MRSLRFLVFDLEKSSVSPVQSKLNHPDPQVKPATFFVKPDDWFLPLQTLRECQKERLLALREVLFCYDLFSSMVFSDLESAHMM
jgi:hypothetical protein